MARRLMAATGLGHNGQVALGVGLICFASYCPFIFQGERAIQYDTMAEKRHAMKVEQDKAEAAAKAAAAAKS